MSRWTQEQEAELYRMFASGMTQTAIAVQAGRTFKAVNSKLKRAGVDTKPKTCPNGHPREGGECRICKREREAARRRRLSLQRAKECNAAIIPGMRVRSNDSRDKHRPTYSIISIEEGKARLETPRGGRRAYVSVHRIFADGRHRSWGWNVVPNTAVAPTEDYRPRERWLQQEMPDEPKPEAETFPERLTRLRIERLWTQKQLAERCGITDDSIGRMERGEHKPRVDVLVSMARALNVTADHLLTGTDPNAALRRAILIGTRPEILLAMARREM